eukprot:Em0023g11a
MDGLIDPKIDQESVSIEAKTVSNDASLCNKLRHHLKPKKRPLIDIPVGAKRKRYVGIDEYECESKGCCWEATSGQPYCFEQSDSGSSFVVSSVASTTLGVKLTLTSNESTEYGQNISPLVVEFSSETNDRLHVKVYDPNNARWEVPANVSPIPIPPSVTPTSPQFTYQYAQVGQPFFFTVIRNSTSEVLFSTAGTSLQFADQYLELSTTLPTNYNIYGLGEHVRPLRISPGSSLTLWNLDIPDPVNINLYGSHPFYLDLRPSGDAHGVFLRNCNGMDVTTDTNLLTYKIIGGILDFYFMLGPEPEAVVQQYHEIIGRPHMPPYWSLGWHQCRYGYPNIQAVEEVVSNYSTNKIPLDTMWTDIDYMDAYKDFTLDPVNYPASQVQSFYLSCEEIVYFSREFSTTFIQYIQHNEVTSANRCYTDAFIVQDLIRSTDIHGGGGGGYSGGGGGGGGGGSFVREDGTNVEKKVGHNDNGSIVIEKCDVDHPAGALRQDSGASTGSNCSYDRAYPN